MKINKRQKKGKFFAAVILLAGLTFSQFGEVYIKAEVTDVDELDAQMQDELDAKDEQRMAGETDTIVSILGDSISTYDNYTSYKVFQGYYGVTNLGSVNNTWWMQYINKNGYRLGVNDSIGGSLVSVKPGEKEPENCMSTVERIGRLDDNGTPDIILFYGGTNDMINKVALGNVNAPVYGNTSNFADAYYTTLMRLKESYPKARIITMTPFPDRFTDDDVCDAYCTIITKLSYRCGVESIDLRSAGISQNDDMRVEDGTHPSKTGMDKICNRLMAGAKYDTFFCDGQFTYYLQHDGSIMRDTLSYDPQGTGLIYMDSEGHMAFDSFQYCKNVGYTCYFDTFGRAYFDQTTFWQGHAYYLDKTGRMQDSGWFQFSDGSMGYANADGTLLTDCTAPGPDGREVYFTWNGRMQQ